MLGDVLTDLPRNDADSCFTHRSSASMICESAETIFSPARTDSALRAVAIALINHALAFAFFRDAFIPSGFFCP